MTFQKYSHYFRMHFPTTFLVQIIFSTNPFQGLTNFFLVQKLVRNVRIKVFWYKIYIFDLVWRMQLKVYKIVLCVTGIFNL